MVKIPVSNPGRVTGTALGVAVVSLGLRIAASRLPWLVPFVEELTGLGMLAIGLVVTPSQAPPKVKAPS